MKTDRRFSIIPKHITFVPSVGMFFRKERLSDMRITRRIKCLLLILTALLATSCIAEDRSKCTNARYLRIHALANTKDLRLYIFGQDGGFIDSRSLTRPDTVANDSTWEVTTEIRNTSNSRVTAIVWGNGQKIPEPYSGAGAGNTYYSLTILENFPYIAQSPDDLSYGTELVALTGNILDTIDLYMARTVAAARITAYGLQAFTGTTDTDFSFVIGKTSGSVTYLNQFFGSKVSYRPPVIKGTGDVFVTPVFYTFPSSGDPVSVDIYHGNDLIYTAYQDQNGQPINLVQNQVLDLTIRLTQGALIVNFTLVPWNYNFIDQIFPGN